MQTAVVGRRPPTHIHMHHQVGRKRSERTQQKCRGLPHPEKSLLRFLENIYMSLTSFKQHFLENPQEYLIVLAVQPCHSHMTESIQGRVGWQLCLIGHTAMRLHEEPNIGSRIIMSRFYTQIRRARQKCKAQEIEVRSGSCLEL